MADYVPEFTSDDIAPIIVDKALVVLIAVSTFAVLFGLIIAFNLMRGRHWLTGKK